MCTYSVCILQKVVGYYELSVLSMSVMGQKTGLDGWGGWGELYPSFFWDFLNFLNFTKPLINFGPTKSAVASRIIALISWRVLPSTGMVDTKY